MFNQVLSVTVRLLFFKAGPQDFPYAPQIGRIIMPLAFVANYLVFSQVLPTAMAVVMGLAMIAGVAVATRGILRMRKLEERFQQTFHALLATSFAFTCALIIPFSQIAPILLDYTSDPEALASGVAPELPAGPAFVINLLNFWNLAVSAHIYRHAANVNIWIGVLVAFLVAAAILFVVVFTGSFAGALLGLGAASHSAPL